MEVGLGDLDGRVIYLDIIFFLTFSRRLFERERIDQADIRMIW